MTLVRTPAPTVPLAPRTRPDEQAARRSLLDQVARLEEELSQLFCSTWPRKGFEWSVRSRGGPRVLSLEELEQLRDDLTVRVADGRRALSERTYVEEQNRRLIEEMQLEPGRYRWVRVANEDIGEPGCKHWHVRPRWGVFGMLMNWWRVVISSGCPLAGRLRPLSHLAKQVVFRRPAQSRGSGPVVCARRTARGRGSARAGSLESFARARSAAAAMASATAIVVTRSSRPRSSRRPTQSSSGVSPAAPIATSTSPSRQARPKRVGDRRRRGGRLAAAAMPVRRRRAERVRVLGQQDHLVLPRRVRLVDAGVGADEAVVGLGRSGRRALLAAARRSRRAPPAPAAGPCRARPRCARACSLGHDLASAPDTALALGDGLVGDHQRRRRRPGRVAPLRRAARQGRLPAPARGGRRSASARMPRPWA